jgi:hypothetical protein
MVKGRAHHRASTQAGPVRWGKKLNHHGDTEARRRDFSPLRRGDAEKKKNIWRAQRWQRGHPRGLRSTVPAFGGMVGRVHILAGRDPSPLHRWYGGARSLAPQSSRPDSRIQPVGFLGDIEPQRKAGFESLWPPLPLCAQNPGKTRRVGLSRQPPFLCVPLCLRASVVTSFFNAAF